MKAVVYTTYGSPEVLEMKEVAKPIPKANEVLIKVHATSINCADGYMLAGKPFLVRLMAGGLLKPKKTILGADISGVVEAVGSEVKSFKVGDAVYGDMANCSFGGLAEYATATEEIFAIKPTNLTFEQAAAVPMAAVTALKGLRDKGRIGAGQKV
ncbi:MAG: NAD(P)-dependent alcohol dehydrogenase, partial [Vallitaleaceae bacterium]|nr:NAD(P)-dependent alcohol dehydrogenase [Vallitaleaceae bacterium]